MGDVRLAMSGAFETVRDAKTPVVTPRRSWLRVLATAAALILVAALAAGAVWILKPAESRPVTRFSHRLSDEVFSRTGRPVVALSRDGRRLAYIADAQDLSSQSRRTGRQADPRHRREPVVTLLFPGRSSGSASGRATMRSRRSGSQAGRR